MRLVVGLLCLVMVGCGHREPPAPAPEAAPVASAASAAAPASPATAAAVPASAPPATPAVELVMDVMQLVGTSEAEVSALLGSPASCEDIHRARLCKYPPDLDEVMFVAGRADMITVQGMGAIAFDEHALEALGLGPAKPDHATDHAIRWESLAGLEEVTVFPGTGNSVRYAYVKVGRH